MERQQCLAALHTFIHDSSNENKLELHLAYDAIEDAAKETILGKELNAILVRILSDNYHPDTYLQSIEQQLFT